MTEELTITEALKLAQNPESREWNDLLARMESPKPWEHKLVRPIIGDGTYCKRCQKPDIGLYDRTPDDECTVPPAVTEPLPCIVARRVHELALREDGFPSRLDYKLCAASVTVRRHIGWQPWWIFYATPAQQLVCLWAAEGRLK